jgi:hypothetical protein
MRVNGAGEIGCPFLFDIQIIFFTFCQLTDHPPTKPNERGMHEKVPLLHFPLAFIFNLRLLPSAVC